MPHDYALQDAEDQWKKNTVAEIQRRAAIFVAVGIPRSEALSRSASEVRDEEDARNDITGTRQAALSDEPLPKVPVRQVMAISGDLAKSARALADSL